MIFNIDEINIYHISMVLLIAAFLHQLKRFYSKKYTSSQTIPRIPFCLPILGHLFYLRKNPFSKLFEWSNKYGNIYEIQLGIRKAIVLNSTNVIRDALVKYNNTFSNRPDLYMLKKPLKGLGIISSDYNTSCIENRNLVMQYLHKTIKFRATNLEPFINNAVQNYLNDLRLNKDKQIYSNDFKISINFILFQRMLIFLYGLDYENKQSLTNVIKKIDENFKNSRIISAFNFIPITRFFKSSIFKNIKEVNNFFLKLTRNKINEHNEHNFYETNDTFIDAYLEKIKLNDSIFNFEQLNALVQDLFLSSTETLSNTISWSILYIAYFQNYQKIVHDEIDQFIGKESKITYQYAKMKTPFIFAFLYETMRYQCSGPILIPRSTSSDTIFYNYHISKDTMILVNMWSCMRDPVYWKNPNQFNPWRFIDEKGFFTLNNPAMIAFSIGRRACLGENLAICELFLIFTGILQKIRLNLVHKPKLLDEIFNYGMNLSPKNTIVKYEFR